mgnify:CR=1 FL=1
MNWEEISFVTRNKIRFSVLISIKNEVKTPTEISKDTSFPITHVSTELKKLEGRGFVKCLDPNVRKNKFFCTTEKGKRLLLEISKLTEL